MLEKIESFSPTSSEFRIKLQELKKAVQTHSQQSNTIINRAQSLINKQAQQLGQDVAIKNKLQAAI